jgi:hypothetical protein
MIGARTTSTHKKSSPARRVALPEARLRPRRPGDVVGYHMSQVGDSARIKGARFEDIDITPFSPNKTIDSVSIVFSGNDLILLVSLFSVTLFWICFLIWLAMHISTWLLS